MRHAQKSSAGMDEVTRRAIASSLSPAHVEKSQSISLSLLVEIFSFPSRIKLLAHRAHYDMGATVEGRQHVCSPLNEDWLRMLRIINIESGLLNGSEMVHVEDHAVP